VRRRGHTTAATAAATSTTTAATATGRCAFRLVGTVEHGGSTQATVDSTQQSGEPERERADRLVLGRCCIS
jgi:hypothetical protein